MRILTDYHHAGLFNSFKLVGKELNIEIYRPYGQDWFKEGFWGVGEPYGNPEGVIKQYLGEDLEEDNYQIQSLPDLGHPGEDRCIGLQTFKDLKFDIIIASIPQHIEKFLTLRNLYQPQAKLIWQQGNPGFFLPPIEVYPNILDSVGQVQSLAKDTYHYLKYHQPFELDIFRPFDGDTFSLFPKVRSFVLSPEQHEVFFSVREALRKLPYGQLDLISYGYRVHGTDENPISGIQNIATLMRNSLAGWHLKSIDGYGHIIHNWAACGKPIFTSKRYYQGKIAEDLLEENVTFFDIETKTPDKLAYIIVQLYKQPNFYEKISSNMIRRFKEVVNFEYESELLENFFGNLR